MNKLGFYFKMAWSNITKNSKFYIPYILTSFITITMFFTLQSFCNNSNLPSSSSFKMLMGFGLPVVLIFSAIFLFYTNSFLIKRRKAEFGLFNILGMEKRHIITLISIETSIIAAISLVLGIGVGILLNKLIFLVLNKVVAFMTPLVFEFSFQAIYKTFLLFSLIYLAILIKNIIEVVKVNPIELLSAGKSGEKEPKAKWVLAIFGIICIGTGYVLSITTSNPLTAIQLFFVAVVLVIIGTYALFLSGTIALLKLLKNKKNYYYKTNHFASISGLLFRMKQNSVGLANICILSTMVIVMIGTTMSLYAGATDIVKTRYPREVTTTIECENKDEIMKKGKAIVDKVSSDTGIEVENYSEYSVLNLSTCKHGSDVFNAHTEGSSLAIFEVYTPNDFETFYEAELPNFPDSQNTIYVGASTSDTRLPEKIILFDEQYNVEYLQGSAYKEKTKGAMSVMVAEAYAIIVPNDAVMDKINTLQYEAYSKVSNMVPSLSAVNINFDLKCDVKDESVFFDKYKPLINELIGPSDDGIVNTDLRSIKSLDFAELTGSFLFLGVFLSVLFLMATVLIMYYKQIVEGYDDKHNFEIMQKVGMDKSEVKRTIKSQVLIMFFLPLIVAFVHMGFALPILFYLLSAFAITNVPLVVICCACTCLVYAIIYGVVYSATAKTYYKIVS